MRTPKNALVAELTAALLPLLTRHDPTLSTLPKNVTKAVEDLAETVLRWQGKQQPTRALSRSSFSESDELARLLDHHLSQEQAHEEQDATTPTTTEAPVPEIVPPTVSITKERRPRLRQQN